MHRKCNTKRSMVKVTVIGNNKLVIASCFCAELYNMQLPNALFGRSPQHFSLKKFLIPFLKNLTWRSFLYVLKKSFSNFQEMKLSCVFFKNVFFYSPFFLYIQNPIIFRTRSIFRTMLYSEPETYSEHCQTSRMKSFAKSPT